MAEKRKVLENCRVLDLSNELGFLCGKIFGDLGADVIKVEKPGGDPARNLGTYYKDQAHPEKNLYWFAYNHNKRGITLDIETVTGAGIFRQLAETADIIIETYPPGFLDSLGLDYDALSQLNPGLVMTSITPFGQTGPYKDYKAADLTLMAMSGFMSLVGDPEKPPVRVTLPQSYLWTGMHAAAGTIMAYYHRKIAGAGQHVDVSAQASLLWACSIAPSFYDYNAEVPKRAGAFITGRSITGAKMRAVSPCKDGYINYIIYGGPAGIRTNIRMTEWMDSRGMAPENLKKKDWKKFNIAAVTQEEIDEIEIANNEFLKTITKQEFFQKALEKDMLGYPVATPEDIMDDEQLQSRGLWKEVAHDDIDEKIVYPSFFGKFSSIACDLWRRAPKIGEHNKDIYGELGYTDNDLVNLKRAKVI
jgi:crotonobetainyl-CoA:carnitine CoA-transferase CaiB-like acyl-CoA transferase